MDNETVERVRRETERFNDQWGLVALWIGFYETITVDELLEDIFEGTDPPAHAERQRLVDEWMDTPVGWEMPERLRVGLRARGYEVPDPS